MPSLPSFPGAHAPWGSMLLLPKLTTHPSGSWKLTLIFLVEPRSSVEKERPSEERRSRPF